MLALGLLGLAVMVRTIRADLWHGETGEHAAAILLFLTIAITFISALGVFGSLLWRVLCKVLEAPKERGA